MGELHLIPESEYIVVEVVSVKHLYLEAVKRRPVLHCSADVIKCFILWDYWTRTLYVKQNSSQSL